MSIRSSIKFNPIKEKEILGKKKEVSLNILHSYFSTDYDIGFPCLVYVCMTVYCNVSTGLMLAPRNIVSAIMQSLHMPSVELYYSKLSIYDRSKSIYPWFMGLVPFSINSSLFGHVNYENAKILKDFAIMNNIDK